MAIKIKRSTGNLAPASLAAGQLAYSEGSTNGGTLYYGEIGGTVREIAGRKFVDKLNGIAAGAEVNTVDSVNGQTGAVVLDTTDLSDFNTAVDARITSAKLTTELGYTPEDAADKGQANGYASLDSAGKVPSSQLPSFVDDVVEAANLAAFPGTGETGKIYVAVDTGKTYRWSGTVYVEISASPGSTDSVTEGSTNLYFTNARARAALSASQNISYNSTTGAFTGPDLTGYALTSSLATVATSGSYNDLSNKPTLFSGSYTDLTNKPTLFTDIVQDTTPQLGGDLDVAGNDIVATVNNNIIVAVTGSGAIGLNHGNPDTGAGVVVGNGTNFGAIFSNGATNLTFGADIDNVSGPVLLTLSAGGAIVLEPRSGSTVDLKSASTRLGTGSAAANLTSNGAQNLTINTNSGTSTPVVTLTQNGGITLQATAATNAVAVVNSIFQHTMNSYTATSGTLFNQAHTTADANNFSLVRSRGTTISPSAVQTGDELAEFVVSGHDGQTGPAGFEAAWGFTTTVIDTPSSNVMPVMTEFKINTAANTLTTYHSISAEDGVFRVISLGAVDGETDLAIDAPSGGNVVISGLSYPTTDGTANQVLTTDGAGNLSWATQASGVTTFVALTDTPSTFTGSAGYYVKVNSGATALEFSQDVDDGTF